MHLSRAHITNFRGISSLTVDFHKGVNVLIGETGTCKTAVLDALRLCMGFALERRDLYLQSEDFHVQANGKQTEAIDIDLTFSEPSPKQRGIFIEMLSLTESPEPTLRLHVQFTRDGDRVRRRIWGGSKEGQDVPYPVLELLYYTYLGALRDTARDLSPRRSNRLSQLLLQLVSEESKREDLAAAINSGVQGVGSWKHVLASANARIQNHLDKMVLAGDASNVSVDFVDVSFREIVESLKIRMPRDPDTALANDWGNKPQAEVRPQSFSITQNSLGYNNLLYIATVLGDLLERRAREPESYFALLIEEPEAHLHPHWQNKLFGYLGTMQSQGVQIIITSHSPTITAKSDIDSLIGMGRTNEIVTSTPVRLCPLTEEDKKHLQRFLDVTKSQLFFARAVILVEGISEALLLPVFATLLNDTLSLEKNGVEIVNVDGVAFEPFATLFNSSEPTHRLNIRCALLTDDDRTALDDISSRAANAVALAKGGLQVFLANHTFEFELYKTNEALVTEQYAKLHPRTDLAFDGDLDRRATAFVDKLKMNKDKALFAQQLASALQEASEAERFTVPDYIDRAVRWVITGNADHPN